MDTTETINGRRVSRITLSVFLKVLKINDKILKYTILRSFKSMVFEVNKLK